MRREPLVGEIVAIRQIFPRSTPLRFALGIQLNFQFRLGIRIELPFHMAPQVEVPAMGNPFQLAELARRQEGKGIFDVGGAACGLLVPAMSATGR